MTEAGLEGAQEYVLKGNRGQLMILETVVAEVKKFFMSGSGRQSNLTGPRWRDKRGMVLYQSS